jgi:hypothetical protein
MTADDDANHISFGATQRPTDILYFQIATGAFAKIKTAERRPVSLSAYFTAASRLTNNPPPPPLASMATQWPSSS